MKSYPGAIRSFVLALLLGGVAGLSTGCRSNAAEIAARTPPEPIAAPTTRPVAVLSKPAIDLTRGGAGFPLDLKHPPATTDELVNALTRAYTDRLEKNPVIDILAEGESVSELDELKIDLSGSTVKHSFAPQGSPREYKGTPFLNVARMSYIANPLHYFNYSASLILDATNAEMSLFAGADGKLSLMMTDCHEGSAKLRVELDDLHQGILAGAKVRKSAAFSISNVQLRLTSRDTHSLEADVIVQAAVLMLPATFRMTGRVDIDDDFNVYFTHLSATGIDASGSLVAGLLQGKLDKLNNKAAPLMRLPGNRVRVTDLKLSLDDALTVDVRFAGGRS